MGSTSSSTVYSGMRDTGVAAAGVGGPATASTAAPSPCQTRAIYSMSGSMTEDLELIHLTITGGHNLTVCMAEFRYSRHCV